MSLSVLQHFVLRLARKTCGLCRAPEPALVLGHAGQRVAVKRVEVVVIRDIMSDDLCVDDVTLALLAGLVQSLSE